MTRRPVLVVFGTCPEAIKLAPVIAALAASRRLTPRVCADAAPPIPPIRRSDAPRRRVISSGVTGRHREMFDQMLGAYLILTGSVGLQEEAPSLGVPVLVMRETTERSEAIEAGTAQLVGSRREAIVAAATRLLNDPAAHAAMRAARNPFGDGAAAPRIAAHLERALA